MGQISKPVYLYDKNNIFMKKFISTFECADYFNKDADYINHNLKYCKKIRKDGKWYIISRVYNE